MLFQTKFRNYAMVVVPRYVKVIPGIGIESTKGLSAVFDPRTKVFDSVKAQEEHGWSDEERITVENWLLRAKGFGNRYYLLPGQKLSEEQYAMMRVKPTVAKRFCVAVAVLNGRVVQCQNEPDFGKEYCKDHDPEESKIVRGTVKQRTD